MAGSSIESFLPCPLSDDADDVRNMKKRTLFLNVDVGRAQPETAASASGMGASCADKWWISHQDNAAPSRTTIIIYDQLRFRDCDC